MRTLLLAASALVLAAGCAKAGAPSSVDRMAKSEVEAIVKDYLIKNPEVVAEVLEELGRHERKKTFQSLLTSGGDPSIGPKDAAVTIVEFFDYNCGYCKAANDWVFEEVDSKKGDVRVIFKEFPILHDTSLVASKAALAADKQGKYREMHIALMKSKDLSQEGIEKTAKSVGLNVERLRKDMENASVLQHIAGVHNQSEPAGVTGTPGFFINGEFLNGFNEERLEKMIEEARAEAKAG